MASWLSKLRHYEGQYIYGASALGLGAYLSIFLFLYVWTGAAAGGVVPAEIDFFNTVFIGSLLGSLALKTLDFGFVGEEKSTYFLYGLAGSFGISIVFSFLGTLSVIYMTVLAALMAAIAEEFFRGFMYPLWTRVGNNRYFGAIISISIWTFLHSWAYWGNPLGFAFVFCNGLVYTWVLEKTQSIDVPVLLHLLNNLAVGLIFLGVW